MKIIKVLPHQLIQLLPLYADARRFMASQGNPTQWGTSGPSAEQLQQDIKDECLYLCMYENQIAAVFCLRPGPDETYRSIQNGAWLNNDAYGVIHRIISTGITHGAAEFCINWALEQYQNIRIDTHKDNLPMQNLLHKLNFIPCGTIHVQDGTPRLAFQKVI